MVTFETKVYENDWYYLLKGNRLKKMIERCNYDFSKKVLFINNVKDRNLVEIYAKEKVKEGIIDDYFVVNDYAKEALDFFKIKKESFKGGYYYSIAELVSIYLCETPYLIHFSSDSILQKNAKSWIDESIQIFKKNNDIIIANPTWDFKFKEVKKEAIDEIENFYIGYGCSDQCYLIKTNIFKNAIYNYKHIDSERYPKYGGELFEKRVDSFLRITNNKRITHKTISYIHKNFFKKGIIKWYYKKLLK